MATRLSEQVWRFDLGAVNAYLVEDDDEVVLIDAGTPWDADDIRSGLSDARYDPGDLDRVLVTHYDLDHVGALAKLDLSATVVMGEPDASVLAGRRKPPWRNHKGAFQRLMSVFVSRPNLTVETIADGDGTGSFTAYHTPGHSPGHMAYVSTDRDVAFVGDLVREKDGRFEPPPWILSYDSDAIRESIRGYADRVPSTAVCCPGHGDPVTMGGHRAMVQLADQV
ncbi:MBL fold hydrolase [Halobacteriales archaeon SW_7_68_16]|nr:MAG: MBL fold hydrolase [Halobacteriales archaeon SW_7_68_16]